MNFTSETPVSTPNNEALNPLIYLREDERYFVCGLCSSTGLPVFNIEQDISIFPNVPMHWQGTTEAKSNLAANILKMAALEIGSSIDPTNSELSQRFLASFIDDFPIDGAIILFKDLTEFLTVSTSNLPTDSNYVPI